ncbi:hypothetical protein SAMN04488004_12210 [Loktanella salsilacus]|uniref:Uncharacterized protein n=1 Tax=Loktanella salsilacus TaxID=195913 RepID=A0A1I4I226_9RHOB|nr:hypothetical protein [Loktanella salsilacus]SFL48502.1 hypothetical protein SAMN04488004_12210 [Loktanella salsilacus]
MSRLGPKGGIFAYILLLSRPLVVFTLLLIYKGGGVLGVGIFFGVFAEITYAVACLTQ